MRPCGLPINSQIPSIVFRSHVCGIELQAAADADAALTSFHSFFYMPFGIKKESPQSNT